MERQITKRNEPEKITSIIGKIIIDLVAKNTTRPGTENNTGEDHSTGNDNSAKRGKAISCRLYF